MVGSHANPPEHGPHTLRVVEGEVVGLSGDDVFVELGPRAQGVISVRRFATVPEIGQRFEFKLHGQEEDLWVLSLAETSSLASWRDMETGALVNARVIRTRPGGLELKVGELHAFMPNSQSGLARGDDPKALVGKSFLCEVLEVDPERQRVFVSRKLVLQREKADGHQRELGHLKPGQVVQGRVVRIEEYGVFLRFGRGLEGLVHVSNLTHDRAEDPRQSFKKGETLSARVLSIRQQGKRISLGVKQLDGDPWAEVERRFYPDQIVEARVSKVLDFGVFLTIARGVEGLLPRSEAALREGRAPREQFHEGDRIAVRIHRLEPEAQRLTFSRCHRTGAEIAADEAVDRSELDEVLDHRTARERLQSSLGQTLRDALDSEGSET